MVLGKSWGGGGSAYNNLICIGSVLYQLQNKHHSHSPVVAVALYIYYMYLACTKSDIEINVNPSYLSLHHFRFFGVLPPSLLPLPLPLALHLPPPLFGSEVLLDLQDHWGERERAPT